jgi:hypothetical protein
MSAAILVAMMIAFPVIVLALNFLQMRDLRKRRDHDRMLYRLCAVRDEAALMAINGELREESEIFSSLYTLSSTIIHNHRRSGLCFRNLIRTFDAHLKSHGEKDSDYSELASEVREAPSRAQKLIEEFCSTILFGYMLSYRVIVLDRLLRRFRNIDWLSLLDKFILRSPEKRVLNFLEAFRHPISEQVSFGRRGIACR